MDDLTEHLEDISNKHYRKERASGGGTHRGTNQGAGLKTFANTAIAAAVDRFQQEQEFKQQHGKVKVIMKDGKRVEGC